MSNRHNAVADLLREISYLSEQEAADLYGIAFLDGGNIHDTVTDRVYNSLGEWAEESVYEEEMEQFEHLHAWEEDY